MVFEFMQYGDLAELLRANAYNRAEVSKTPFMRISKVRPNITFWMLDHSANINPRCLWISTHLKFSRFSPMRRVGAATLSVKMLHALQKKKHSHSASIFPMGPIFLPKPRNC